MSLRRAVTFALLAALVFPAGAAAGVRLVSRDEPLSGERSLEGQARVLPPRTAPFPFQLLGLHWRGSGRVWFRTADEHGRWSAWRPARPEGEDLPDRGTPEARARPGWKIGNPYWTGSARRIQYRLAGRVSRLRAHFVASPSRRVRRAAIARAPAIIRRSAWGANEAIVRGRPSYASAVRFAVLHHTAGSSPATPAQSAAIVRGIQAYHVLGNGWNDIGYNFLVDRFGQIFEGRAGGVARNVVGAHAQGFNTGSVGVAVIGSYQSASASPEAQAAVASLLAWRLDVAHVDPLASLSWTSAGNPRFPAGAAVPLKAVSGHRDTGYTACPGDALYRRLGPLTARAAGLGLPKLYDPAVRGSLGGPIRFTARLSEPRSWTVTVTDAMGAVVASGQGSGAAIDWTWNSTGTPPGAYTYVIGAGAGVRPAKGSLGATLALAGVRATPAVVTPNGDGVDDETTISFTLTVAATVTVSLADAAGTPVGTLVADRAVRAGTTRIRWAGTADGAGVPDGRYRVFVAARAGASEARGSARVVVDRTLARLTASPRAFSPNGDGRRDTLTVGFDLARQADVRARVVSGSRTIATLFSGTLAGGERRRLTWDGRGAGRRVADGRYQAVVEATTEFGTRALARPFMLDTTPPRISALSATSRRGRTTVRFFLSERARVAVSFAGTRFVVARPAGRVVLTRAAAARRVRAVAEDAAGNVGRPVAARVRR